ncbi:hypothetical protein EB796_013893 [Bugula neritina]|uniref:Uncharacterized protein n=1 Tax=Bugula neritina TaxID=10212 RepID=A0A7J7JP45_BUGNE|nr:hypothetical protein EB796_013893 [Bugula neritina]
MTPSQLSDSSCSSFQFTTRKPRYTKNFQLASCSAERNCEPKDSYIFSLHFAVKLKVELCPEPGNAFSGNDVKIWIP